MLLTGLVTISAFLLLGLGATRTSRGALYMTGGILLILVSASMHVAQFEGAWSTFGALATEIGIGSMLLAGLLRRRSGSLEPRFRSAFSPAHCPKCISYPRPMYGIFVAMIVMNCTFDSSGRSHI